MGEQRQKNKGRRRFRIVAMTGGTLLIGLLLLLGVARQMLTGYQDPWHEKVAAAGYQQKQVRLNQLRLNYVEGPDNGPPLLLLHAQHMEWLSYSRVLPRLAESFHVFAVDYPGHGTTVGPPDYPMTANRIGTDLGDFIVRVIGEPAFVTGNSSGGLLAVWLAANRPGLVRAVLLEDPPLFSAEYPRIRETIAYRSFVTSHEFVEEGGNDFLLYWIDRNRGFFDNNVFRGAASLLTLAVNTYRNANPGVPVEIRFLPNDTVRLLVRGLDRYDPRFGAAFFDGSWNDGFDHAEALMRITCPVLLLHASFRYLEDGTLAGAMSQEEADRVMSLLNDGRYLKVDASHVVHLDQPAEFIGLVEDFFLEPPIR